MTRPQRGPEGPRCQEWLGGNQFCGQPGIEVLLPCPARRPDAVATFCSEHGGEARARQEAARDWNYLAPKSVGGLSAVEDAGCAILGTREAYVVVRQTPADQGGVWLAWIGLGSHLTPVSNPAPEQKLKANGELRKPRGGRKLKPRPGNGTRAFPTRTVALTAAKAAWSEQVRRTVNEIRQQRGGTLDWGSPVEPLSEPIVILLEQGDNRSAWDIAKALSRRTREGVGRLTGLRPGGEVI